MSQTAGAIQYNDAKACYDRLIEAQCNLSLRALGCPSDILKLHSKVMQEIRYHVKTTNGIAKEFSTHTNEPFWGAGQGACDASARCTATSATMFHAYDKVSYPF